MNFNSHFNKSIFQIFLCSCFFFILISCRVEEQDLSKVFQLDGNSEIPKELVKAANQFSSLQNINPNNVNKRKGLKIAIVGEGVDLTHPDLQSSLVYQFNEFGAIQSVGKDFMGNDSFASANRIDPSLFAFTAETVKDGKIINYKEKPLERLLQINEQFITRLKNKVTLSQSLKNSIFPSINLDQHLTVYGLWYYYKHDDWQKEPRHLSDFPENLFIDQFTIQKLKSNPEFLKSVKKSSHSFSLSIALGNMLIEADNNFKERGVSKMMRKLDHFREAQTFKKLAVETLEEINNKFQLEKSIRNMEKFGRDRNRYSATESQDDIENDIVDKLNESVFIKKYGVAWFHPANEVYNQVLRLQENLYSFNGFLLDRNHNAYNQSIDYLKWMLQSIQDKIKKGQSNHDFTLDKDIKEGLNRLILFEKIVQWYKDRNDGILNFPFTTKIKNTEKYSHHFSESINPYIDKDSLTDSKDTHVSGIASIQHPENRIYPIKITHSKYYASEKEKQEKLKAVKNQFFTWLNLHPIIKGTKELLTKTLPGSAEMILTLSDKELALFAFKNFEPFLESAVLEDYFLFKFVDDTIQAIQHIGENHIKVANISLGQNFTGKVPNINLEDPRLKIKSLFQLFKVDFLKHKVAQSIHQSAQQTIFVIATGDQGKWLDGLSQSALPVDLRSTYFSQFENEEHKLENNHLKNIIAVGSLANKEDLSNFTNILVGQGLPPFILAQGERVYSPIRTQSTKPADNLIRRELESIRKFVRTEFSSIQRSYPEFILKNPQTIDLFDEKQRSESNEQKSEYYTFPSDLFFYFSDLWDLIVFEISLLHPLNRSFEKGTNIATPVVSGKLAGYIFEKMKLISLNEEDIYFDKNFSPETLISEFFEQYADDESNHLPFSKIVNENKFSKTENYQKLKDFLKLFK